MSTIRPVQSAQTVPTEVLDTITNYAVEAAAPIIYRQGQIDTLKAVLARSRNGATGRALLLWVHQQLVDLEAGS